MSQQKLSVQQPPRSGNDYPFMFGGEQLATVILDMAIEHPADAKLPLRIITANNLQVGNVQASTMQLVIVDRDDTVVFDTAVDEYQSQHLWGNYYATYTWYSEDDRLLRFTIGSANQNGFPASLTNLDAVIDPRTYVPVLPGVRRLRVFNRGGGLMDVIGNANPVRLRTGFNMQYTVEPDPVRDYSGGKATKVVSLAAVPQQGLGQFNNCGDQESPFVRSLNQQTPAARGSFLMRGDSCFRFEPVVTFDENDVATITHGQINVFDDCEACCDCEDYLRPYYAIQRAKRRAEPIAEQLDSIRLRYAAAVDKLQLVLNCLLDRDIRLDASATNECEIQIAVGIFNGGLRAAFDIALDIRVLWQDDVGDWFPADIYKVPTVALHTAKNALHSTAPLRHVAAGQIHTEVPCVPAGELHSLLFAIDIWRTRKVKVCVGYRGSDNDQYVCRDVFTNCTYQPLNLP